MILCPTGVVLLLFPTKRPLQAGDALTTGNSKVDKLYLYHVINKSTVIKTSKLEHNHVIVLSTAFCIN